MTYETDFYQLSDCAISAPTSLVVCMLYILLPMPMSDLTLRPRFQLMVSAAPEVILEHINAKLLHATDLVEGKVVQHHVMISISAADRHYWSPQLALEIEADGDHQSLIRGLIGPSPNVWTKFVFLYFASGFAIVTASVITLSQWTLGKSMWGLWVLAIALAVMVGTTFMGQAGKKIAQKQTSQLTSFFHTCIDAFENRQST